MAEIYDTYASLFLHSNAAFLCERAHAEKRTAETLEALASCYLRQGAAKRAYGVLRGQATTPHGRYLLALACQKLDKHEECEAALLPDRAARAAGPRDARQRIAGPDSAVPHGAAGLHMLGVVCERTHRREFAVDYYRLAPARELAVGDAPREGPVGFGPERRRNFDEAFGNTSAPDTRRSGIRPLQTRLLPHAGSRSKKTL